MAKFSVTTKTGDEGLTSLFSGERVPKDHPRPMAYGEVDMLENMLGLARLHCEKEENKEALLYLQRALFRIGSELATTPVKLRKLKNRVDEEFLAELDRRRDALEETITLPNGFVVTGGSLASAHLDLARTQARRCERLVTGLVRSGEVENKIVLVWLNRLSDYLYLLARNEGGEPTLVKLLTDRPL
ncbi:MAG: cob(I)yrinic acid a,c-diamide adenosyltransferase [Deltaproteobacteria bacterium]|nr:cob(I)yrinic acid a,c-diamide adenosyltransferase [Deltaproteobacteria bacterium]